MVRHRSRFLRCSPADFRFGSDRTERDGHGIASLFLLVNINPVVGGFAGGDLGEGAAGRQSRSSTYPRALCFVDLARRTIAQALVLALLVIQSDEITPIGSRYWRFSTGGIHGSGALFISMR